MNTPKLLSITAILALALTGAKTFATGAPASKADAITFKAVSTTYVTGGAATVALGAAAASKAAIHYVSSDPTILSVNDSTGKGTILKAGSVYVTASTPSTIPSGYTSAAPAVTVTVTIAKAAAPKVTIKDSGSGKFTYAPNTPFTTTLTGLPSDWKGSVTYSSTGPVSVNASTGAGSITGAGAATVTATFGTDSNYASPAAQVDKITIAPGVATVGTISFSAVNYSSNATVTIPTPTLSPSQANTGVAFTYTTKAKTAKITGNTITLLGAGPVDIEVAWTATANFVKGAVTTAIGTLTVNKGDDSITKTPISIPAPGASISLPTLKSAGGQPVVFTLVGSGAALASGKLTPSSKATGQVTVTGTTAVNANYNVATPISYTIGWSYDGKAYHFSAL
jgi:hypothetical protein